MSLVPSDRPIAVIAPCGAYDPVRFERGLQIARRVGLDLRPLPGLLQPHRYLAGTDAHRLEQLNQALTDPQYGAVWIARGGYGLTRLLDHIDLSSVPDGRPVIGFSDVTALHLAMHRAGKGPCIHGPVIHSLPITDEDSLDHLWDLLAGRPTAPLTGRSWIAGTAEGAFVGGNLCLIAATCGTAHQLDARGCILAIEEVGEPAYRVDRMVQQLHSAGVFDGVVGIAVGEMVDCKVPEGVDWTLRDMLIEQLEPLGVPVIGDLPFGHGARNRAFVYGARARLDDTLISWTD